MKVRSASMWCCALALLAGLAMRWVGMAHAGWVIGAACALWVFLFLLPAMGGRAREPSDSPLRRARWGD